MSSRKRAATPFDPSAVKQKVARRIDARDEVIAKAEQLIEAVRRLIVAEDIEYVCSKCDNTTAQVILTAKVGLEGCEAIKFANHHIPATFLSNRVSRIRDIVFEVASQQLSSVDNGEKVCSAVATVLEKRFPTYWQRKVSEISFATELQAITERTGTSCFKFVAPPVCKCLNETCKLLGSFTSLAPHHDPINVLVFTIRGSTVATKVSLRCKACSTIYNYAMYGKKSEGEMYYHSERSLVEVTDRVYVERGLHELFCSLSMHCWTSFSGLAEVYFEYSNTIQDQASHWMLQWLKEKKTGQVLELSRKQVADMFFTAELEKEIRSRGKEQEWKFGIKGDAEDYMVAIEANRAVTLYPHSPSPECLSKGCGRCYSMDGNWKLTFPHCMFPVKAEVSLPLVNFPSVCPNQPQGNTAFCKDHLELAQSLHYPTDIKGFVAYCGANSKPTFDTCTSLQGELQLTKDHTAVTKSLDAISSTTTPSNAIHSVQGTLGFLQKFPNLGKDFSLDESQPTCRKDLGDQGKLRHWSRGHLFIVRSCGHIDSWSPLFKSESPSQVFLIVLTWLYETLSHIPPDQWQDVVLAYDNMCHLASLRASQAPLPLPAPYHNMWLKISKVIDDLHIKNHVDEKCLELYNPKKVREKHPNYNFMVAEQTFVWLSRYKRMVCSMNKTHHLFFLHRMVVRRNIYTEICYKLGRRALLPKSKKN